jgi:hypothetical protein
VLFGRAEPDWGSGALITLLDMVSATSVVVGGSVAWARARAIADGDWPAGDVTGAIAEDCAEIVLAWMVDGAVVVPTTF